MKEVRKVRSGMACAHLGDELEEYLRRAAALHALEHRGRGVLQGNVNVAAQARVRGEHFKQARGDLVGIGVEETDPAEILDLRELFEQRGEAILNAEVFAEAGCVLPDEVDFAHALGGEALGLDDDRGDGARAELAAELRNDAEGAGMIAAFGNLDVGGVASGGEQARGVLVVEIAGQLGGGSVPGVAREASGFLAGIAFGTRGRPPRAVHL